MLVLWRGKFQNIFPLYTILNSLVFIQKKIVRMLSFKTKYDHTDPLFHQFNMLKIERIINEYMSLIFVYNSLKTIPICSGDTFRSITIQD